MQALLRDTEWMEPISRMPCLTGATTISELNGGLTNKNYRIDGAGNSFVMRVSSEKGRLLCINREHERINTGRAFQAGIGAELVGSLPEEHIMVLRWIEARTLHKEDIQTETALLPRIAQALKTLHSGPAFEGEFHFPAIRRQYLNTVLDSGYFLPAEYLDIEPLIQALEKKLAENPEEPVPCNNDLLAENFLDDGHKIWIIDYEYAGQNEASFEIGNFAGETGLTDEALARLCHGYWQEHSAYRIARAKAWSIIARFGWVMWASIQEAVSPIAFDFRSWGLRKWNSVLPELQGRSYQQIIENLTI